MSSPAADGRKGSNSSKELEQPVRSGRHANTTLVMLFLSLGGLSFAVLQSLVAPALPAVARDLHVSTGNISWLLTAYLLAASVFTPVLGRIGDMFGKRRVMLIGLLFLAAGTVLAAMSRTLSTLVIGRVLQGAGGGILPLSIGIVRDELPKERVGVTVGLLSAIFGIGGGLGIVLAGPIVDHLSWQWLFWFPLILVVIAFLGVAFGVPESAHRTEGRVDILGAAILSASLASLLLGLTEGGSWGWGEAKTLATIIGGLAGLLVFVVVEKRVDAPLVDMKLMSIRGVWATNMSGLVFGFALFGMFIMIPTLLELPKVVGYGFGKTVSQAGLYLLPAAVMMLVFGTLSGLLGRRFGPKLPLFLGAVAISAAFVIPALAHGSISNIVWSAMIVGAGIGLSFAAMANAIVESVPASHTGEAIAVNTIVRTVGGSIGTAVMAAVISSNSTARGLPTDRAFTIGFWVCAVVGVLGIAAVLALPSRRGRTGVRRRPA